MGGNPTSNPLRLDTPLIFAASRGFKKVVKMLLEHGSSLALAPNKRIDLSLERAADPEKMGDPSRGIKPKGAKRTALFLAYVTGLDREITKMLLEHPDTDLNWVSDYEFGFTLLHEANRIDCVEDVKMVLDCEKRFRDIDIMSKKLDGNGGSDSNNNDLTQEDNCQSLRLSIDSDSNILNNHSLSSNNDMLVSSALLARKTINLNVYTHPHLSKVNGNSYSDGQTAFHMMCRSGATDSVKLLLSVDDGLIEGNKAALLQQKKEEKQNIEMEEKRVNQIRLLKEQTEKVKQKLAAEDAVAGTVNTGLSNSGTVTNVVGLNLGLTGTSMDYSESNYSSTVPTVVNKLEKSNTASKTVSTSKNSSGTVTPPASATAVNTTQTVTISKIESSGGGGAGRTTVTQDSPMEKQFGSNHINSRGMDPNILLLQSLKESLDHLETQVKNKSQEQIMNSLVSTRASTKEMLLGGNRNNFGAVSDFSLLDYRLDLTLRTTEKRWSVLHCCAAGGSPDTMKLVLEALKIRNQLGPLLCDYSLQNNGQRIPKFVGLTPPGHSPLHLAALFGPASCLQLLLKAKADPNFRSNDNIAQNGPLKCADDVRKLVLGIAQRPKGKDLPRIQSGGLMARSITEVAVLGLDTSGENNNSEDNGSNSNPGGAVTNKPPTTVIHHYNSYSALDFAVALGGESGAACCKVLLQNNANQKSKGQCGVTALELAKMIHKSSVDVNKNNKSQSLGDTVTRGKPVIDTLKAALEGKNLFQNFNPNSRISSSIAISGSDNNQKKISRKFDSLIDNLINDTTGRKKKGGGPSTFGLGNAHTEKNTNRSSHGLNNNDLRSSMAMAGADGDEEGRVSGGEMTKKKSSAGGADAGADKRWCCC